ncbi:MAG: beta-galactosidase trimerization domain-containing protein [Clostridia bacterium]|nr:beta-galactosidase trimerization domain-containing protein [Clostridia bacterium]
MAFRQVHLDFHTSEKIPDIGSRFDKAQFQEALRVGHVNSITVFSKCHHGYTYHPTEAGVMHPGLSFDLLGAQLEACREIGVNAPVYLSAGHDERYTRLHPEELLKLHPDTGHDFLKPAFRHVCLGGPYLEVLAAQVEEVMQRYHPSGIFFDICSVMPCYCNNCLAKMEAAGLDPTDIYDVLKQGEITYANFTRRMEKAVRRLDKDTTIFYNGGHILRGRRDMAHRNTHLELESLPTGGWGYDHFPLSAAYARTIDMEYLGMTGKFHKGWGEFGGFKHPNALRYEVALSAAQGAKCSIGDQMHPSGEMDMATYRLIGQAYAELEQKEPWLTDSRGVADIAILSSESVTAGHNAIADTGAARILLEGKYLFDVVDTQATFSAYKLLILPDVIRVDESLCGRLQAYVAAGGKLLVSGRSGLWAERDSFALDLGVTYEGEHEHNPTYYRPLFDTLNGTTNYVQYAPAYTVKAVKGEVLAQVVPPYFNRTYAHFCSHHHAPAAPDGWRDGVVLTENTAYIAWDIFEEYGKVGAYHVKELVCYLIEQLVGEEKTLTVGLPDRGVVTLREQPAHNRYIAHLLFAHTTLRGERVEVIEDVVPLYHVPLAVRLPEKPTKVYLAPTGEKIPFTYESGILRTEIEQVYIHQMVIIDFH